MEAALGQEREERMHTVEQSGARRRDKDANKKESQEGTGKRKTSK